MYWNYISIFLTKRLVKYSGMHKFANGSLLYLFDYHTQPLNYAKGYILLIISLQKIPLHTVSTDIRRLFLNHVLDSLSNCYFHFVLKLIACLPMKTHIIPKWTHQYTQTLNISSSSHNHVISHCYPTYTHCLFLHILFPIFSSLYLYIIQKSIE